MAAKMGFGNVSQPGLKKHDSSVLDLAFVMDCTSSMGPFINQAQQSIRVIVEKIVAHENSDVHMALVEFRDHPPQDTTFVTRTNDFTPSIQTMKAWLNAASAEGGGDWPEAVADALHDLRKLSWRPNACKIAVAIVDAPPHGLILDDFRSDTFPDGCPDGYDPVRITNELASKGITLYVVGCEPRVLPSKEFYSAMAYLTGGQYVPLSNAQLLSQVIIGGALEEISLKQLLEEVETEVKQEYKKHGDVSDEVSLAKKIHKKLSDKGTTSVTLQRNGMAIPEASMQAQRMSKMNSMRQIQQAYKASSMSCEDGMGSASSTSDGYPHQPPLKKACIANQNQVSSPSQGSLIFAPTQMMTNRGMAGGHIVQEANVSSQGGTTRFNTMVGASMLSSGPTNSISNKNSTHSQNSDIYSSLVQTVQPQQTQRLVQKAIKMQRLDSS